MLLAHILFAVGIKMLDDVAWVSSETGVENGASHAWMKGKSSLDRSDVLRPHDHLDLKRMGTDNHDAIGNFR